MKLSRLPASAFLLAASILVVAVLNCPKAFAADLPAALTSELDVLEKNRLEALAEVRRVREARWVFVFLRHVPPDSGGKALTVVSSNGNKPAGVQIDGLPRHRRRQRLHQA